MGRISYRRSNPPKPEILKRIESEKREEERQRIKEVMKSRKKAKAMLKRLGVTELDGKKI